MDSYTLGDELVTVRPALTNPMFTQRLAAKGLLAQARTASMEIPIDELYHVFGNSGLQTSSSPRLRLAQEI